MDDRPRRAGRNAGDAASPGRGARAPGRGSRRPGRRHQRGRRRPGPRALFLEEADPPSARRRARRRSVAGAPAHRRLRLSPRSAATLRRARRSASSRRSRGSSSCASSSRACRSPWSRSQPRRSRCASSTIPRMSRRSRMRWRRPGSNELLGPARSANIASIFCDVWGVVHDGVRLYPGAAERLRGWRRRGAAGDPRHQCPAHRGVGRATACPHRPAATIAGTGSRPAARRGSPHCWQLGAPVGFIGIAARPRGSRRARRVQIADSGFSPISPAPGSTASGSTPRIIARELEACLAAGVHAALPQPRPDRDPRRGRGSSAPARSPISTKRWAAASSGTASRTPTSTSMRLHLAGDPPVEAVLAVGDSLRTDVLGAARMGIDAVFVAGGIHRGEPFRPPSPRKMGLATGARSQSSTVSPK